MRDAATYLTDQVVPKVLLRQLARDSRALSAVARIVVQKNISLAARTRRALRASLDSERSGVLSATIWCCINLNVHLHVVLDGVFTAGKTADWMLKRLQRSRLQWYAAHRPGELADKG